MSVSPLTGIIEEDKVFVDFESMRESPLWKFQIATQTTTNF